MVGAELKNIRHAEAASGGDYGANNKEQVTGVSRCVSQQLQDGGHMTHSDYFLRFNIALARSANSRV